MWAPFVFSAWRCGGFFAPGSRGFYCGRVSPHMAVDERLRRLAPIATGGAAFGLAVLRMRGGVFGDGALGERELVAAALIACAAALVAHAMATVRGSMGVIAGVAGGLWLAATAAAAAAVSATAAVTAIAAGVLVVVLARADKLESAPPLIAAPVAAALVIFDPRAWALAAAVAALIVWRDNGRRRWLAAAPAIAATVGGVLTLLAALGRSPTWAPHVSRVAPTPWLNDTVDVLGPVAIIVGGLGAIIAIEDRRARWTSAGIVGALVAALPLTATVPSTALVGLATALGMSVTAISVRVGRMRQQALVGAAIAAVLVLQLVI